jgi:hypothetical protein
MARVGVSFPQVRGKWEDWAPTFLRLLTEQLNRTQRTDEEFEPPHAPGAGSRIILSDTDGVRWEVTVDTSGNLVTNAL